MRSELRSTWVLGRVLVMFSFAGVLSGKCAASDDSLVLSIQRTSDHFPHVYKFFRLFLHSFTKLRIETVNLIMSVRPIGIKPLPLDGLPRNSVFEYFRNTVEKINFRADLTRISALHIETCEHF